MTVTLLAVDEHPVLRVGLSVLATQCPDITFAGGAGSIAEAVALTRTARPDVVTLGLRFPDGDGVVACRQLRGLAPGLGVVLLGEQDHDEALLLRCIEAGASAYVAKSGPDERVIAAIRHAAADPHTFTWQGLAAMLRGHQLHQGPLSEREQQVLELLSDGRSVVVIAEWLGLSESTVKTYVSRIYGKLRVNNRAQALVVALNQGLVRRRVDAA